MISTTPVHLFSCHGTETTVDHTRPDLVAASSTAKLDATQRELSNALTACALAKESNAQLEKR
jgi:hypothetical protein